MSNNANEKIPNPMDNPKIRNTMNKILETEEGRKIASTIQKKLKDLGKKFKTLKDEDKKEFTQEFQQQFTDSLKNLGEQIEKVSTPDELEELDKEFNQTSHNLTIFYFAIVIVILIFVFIGYKLYKSLMEKDRKREEKQKAKQSKKKK